ncbi:MAG TPA: SEC-C domain-containing protein [Gammaproteobacteria bacterium]|nr:SEC-C domain-containing protein [Gammaproteobacteria bacterium]
MRYQGIKIGRNERCPCGSGIKFKRCHGNLNKIILDKNVQKIIKRKQAEEIRRKKQQGWGKPIISAAVENHRVVIVGNRMYTGKWETFHDFLYSHLLSLFGQKWHDEQRSDTDEFKHPLIRAYDSLVAYRATLEKVEGKVSAPYTGAVSVFMWLSYNLYLISHNAELLELLIKRLKNKEQFASAYYETFVAAIFIKAGYVINFENESDKKSTHCEFIAIHTETGQSFSVEAKYRHRLNDGFSHDGSPNLKLDIGGPINKALAKEAKHERVIFVDINLPFIEAAKFSGEILAKQLRKLEHSNVSTKTNLDKSAYVFLTNHPYHYNLDGPSQNPLYFSDGFNMDDYGFKKRTLAQLIADRKKHAPIHKLWESIEAHTVIPDTFDGTLTELKHNRLLYGEKYELSDQEGKNFIVTLKNAVVNIKNKTATGICSDHSGKCFIVNLPLSDDEISAYEKSPDTFFGEYQEVPRGLKSPLDAFDFAMKGFNKLAKEELIKRLCTHYDINELNNKSRDELLEIYCMGIAAHIYKPADKSG